jgi:hypothetical protein
MNYVVYDPAKDGQIVKVSRVPAPGLSAWSDHIEKKGWRYIEGFGPSRGYVENDEAFPLNRMPVTIEDNGRCFTLKGVPDGAHVFVNGVRYTEPPWEFDHEENRKTVIDVKKYRFAMFRRSIIHDMMEELT